MACQICRIARRPDYFATGRVAICKLCIDSLNETAIAPRQAKDIIGALLRNGIHNRLLREERDPASHDRASNDLSNFDAIYHRSLPQWLNDFVSGERTTAPNSDLRTAVLVLRAYRKRLLRLNPSVNARYPPDWPHRAARARGADGSRCRLCSAEQSKGVIQLHVHHTIHRARGGSHHPKNLVTLCHECHALEHPGVAIRRMGGDEVEYVFNTPVEDATVQQVAVVAPVVAPVESDYRNDISVIPAEVLSEQLAEGRMDNASITSPPFDAGTTLIQETVRTDCFDHSTPRGGGWPVFALLCFAVGGILLVAALILWLRA